MDDYRCRLGLLNNSSTTSGSSDHNGTVGPRCSYAVGTSFFRARFTSIFTLFLYLCLISILLFLCANVREHTWACVPHFL